MSRPSRSSVSRPNRGAPAFPRKKKACPFRAAGVTKIDYKDLDTLNQFVTERGKILPRRITGVSYHFQKLLKNAIKRARHIAFLPFVAEE